MHGLNQYDYAARFYDPGFIRFTTMDPDIENYYSWSPYTYVRNNPMLYIDPDGKNPIVGGLLAFFLWMTSDAVVAPTMNPEAEAVAIKAVRDSHDMDVVGTILPVAGGPAMGPVSKVLTTQAGKTVAQQVEKKVINEVIKENNPLNGGNSNSKSNRTVNIQSIEDQAKHLSKKINKNSVQIKTSEVKYHYDLQGAPHKGVKTTHVQRFFKNTNPETGKTYWNKDTKWVEPMTQKDIRLVKKHIDKK